MFISGVSCRFSKSNTKRGVKVLLCGLAVTAATFFAVPDMYIRFGILHFLGSVMIITGLFERLVSKEKTRQLIMWLASPLSLFLGRLFAGMRMEIPFLLIFGITAAGFASYDYYPIFPWAGVFFAGYAAGLFIRNNRKKLSLMRSNRSMRALCALGRISLVYYLAHQPVLIAALFAFDKLSGISFNL
jgi:uncharacterized membrane protein